MGEWPNAKLLLTNEDSEFLNDASFNLNDDVRDNGSEFGIDDDDDDKDDDTYTTSQTTQQITAQNVQPNQWQSYQLTSKSATNNGEGCIVVEKMPRTTNINSSVKIESTQQKLSLLGSENQSDVSSKKGKKLQ